MSLSIDFENIFILISLNILNIELEKNSDINKSKNFNINIQIYLVFKKEYEEFTVIRVNFNIVKRNDEKHPYNENDLYLESNNTGYNNIIQMNYIYNYYIFYLESKAINNFFFKAMFIFIKKVYREEEIRHQIFIIRIAIYRTFISLFKYLSIYIKERVILKRYQKSFYLEYYFEKIKK